MRTLRTTIPSSPRYHHRDSHASTSVAAAYHHRELAGVHHRSWQRRPPSGAGSGVPPSGAGAASTSGAGGMPSRELAAASHRELARRHHRAGSGVPPSGAGSGAETRCGGRSTSGASLSTQIRNWLHRSRTRGIHATRLGPGASIQHGRPRGSTQHCLIGTAGTGYEMLPQQEQAMDEAQPAQGTHKGQQGHPTSPARQAPAPPRRQPVGSTKKLAKAKRKAMKTGLSAIPRPLPSKVWSSALPLRYL